MLDLINEVPLFDAFSDVQAVASEFIGTPSGLRLEFVDDDNEVELIDFVLSDLTEDDLF